MVKPKKTKHSKKGGHETNDIHAHENARRIWECINTYKVIAKRQEIIWKFSAWLKRSSRLLVYPRRHCIKVLRFFMHNRFMNIINSRHALNHRQE